MPQFPLNQPVPISYAHISNAGTTAVKAAPGELSAINLNGFTGTPTLTLIDNVGTNTTPVIGVISVVSGTPVPSNIPQGAAGGGLRFKTGLIVVATGTIDATIGFN